ncbi:MAG: hypothetical protein QGG48_13925 [Desulfatiglandales bacterium]|jgi:hypothetical protein|nr:hypothetical protein [Desulfatiglandales bacterium]
MEAFMSRLRQYISGHPGLNMGIMEDGMTISGFVHHFKKKGLV